MSSLPGRTLHIEYDNGMAIDVAYSVDWVTWTHTSGQSSGLAGANPASLRQVSDDIWFASWLEDSTTSVSQVLDLANTRVYAYATFPVGDARRSMSVAGVIHDVG